MSADGSGPSTQSTSPSLRDSRSRSISDRKSLSPLLRTRRVSEIGVASVTGPSAVRR